MTAAMVKTATRADTDKCVALIALAFRTGAIRAGDSPIITPMVRRPR